jgi:glutamate-1-semialdehyde 2,1-aminomutase
MWGYELSRYTASEEWLKYAEKFIPLGSQTFSKSRTQYPVGISPLFINKGRGSKVWDLDGNKYIDLVSSLASVTMGYSNSEINRAVRQQLRKGVTFSLPGKLEAQVSALISELVPAAEMVRFGKNGSDATSAAVRLARAYTGKNRVAVCGYHGWQDWYIGSTTRNKGVPKEVASLTSSFEFNNKESFNNVVSEHSDLACIIMEPMNVSYPDPGFLELIRKTTTEKNIILIFDETITGFRFSAGGAQELFGIKPDLSTFGKGIANGFPLSAVVGKKEIMEEMENIFFSSTFGGELLSLAAAKVVLDSNLKNRITPVLEQLGSKLQIGVDEIIEKYGLKNVLSTSGHPSWIFLNWKSDIQASASELRTYFIQEMFRRGILLLNTHNVNTALSNRDLNKILDSYDEVLRLISQHLLNGSLREALEVKPLEPLFKVR